MSHAALSLTALGPADNYQLYKLLSITAVTIIDNHQCTAMQSLYLVQVMPARLLQRMMLKTRRCCWHLTPSRAAVIKRALSAVFLGAARCPPRPGPCQDASRAAAVLQLPECSAARTPCPASAWAAQGLPGLVVRRSERVFRSPGSCLPGWGQRRAPSAAAGPGRLR